MFVEYSDIRKVIVLMAISPELNIDHYIRKYALDTMYEQIYQTLVIV